MKSWYLFAGALLTAAPPFIGVAKAGAADDAGIEDKITPGTVKWVLQVLDGTYKPPSTMTESDAAAAAAIALRLIDGELAPPKPEPRDPRDTSPPDRAPQIPDRDAPGGSRPLETPPIADAPPAPPGSPSVQPQPVAPPTGPEMTFEEYQEARAQYNRTKRAGSPTFEGTYGPPPKRPEPTGEGILDEIAGDRPAASPQAGTSAAPPSASTDAPPQPRPPVPLVDFLPLPPGMQSGIYRLNPDGSLGERILFEASPSTDAKFRVTDRTFWIEFNRGEVRVVPENAPVPPDISGTPESPFLGVLVRNNLITGSADVGIGSEGGLNITSLGNVSLSWLNRWRTME